MTTLNNPLRPSEAEIVTQPQASIGGPLLVSWTALVALTAALSVHVVTLATSAPEQRLRILELERAVDKTIDQCTDVYNYSCGNFDQFEIYNPWHKTSVLVNRRLSELSIFKECKNLPASFWTDQPGTEGSGDQDCDVECKKKMLMDGWTVNNITARVTAVNKTYKLVLWTDDDNDNRTDCAWENSEVISGKVCTNLELNEALVRTPSDFPADCYELLAEHSMEAVAEGFTLNEDEIKSLTEVSSALLDAAEQLETKPTVLFGGGRGLMPDSTLGSSNVKMWTQRRQSENELLGQTVDPNKWTTPATTVNAFFDKDSAAIYIPAGIIRPPFFSAEWSNELVYGGLGFIIAHEIGHAIDCTINDTSLLHEIGYSLASRAHVPYKKAKVTEHEDIADRYGMMLVENVQKVTANLALEFAQMWCMSSTNFTKDPHAPGRWRVNSTLGDSKGWRELACEGRI